MTFMRRSRRRRPGADIPGQLGPSSDPLSLVSGLLVRVSGVFGVALLLTYWTAHMDFPYIESHVNLIIDYHIVYATLTTWLVVVNAGHVWGSMAGSPTAA